MGDSPKENSFWERVWKFVLWVWRKIYRRRGTTLILGDVEFDYRFLIVVFYGVLGPMIYWYHPTWESLAPPLASAIPNLLGEGPVEIAHMQFYLFFVAPMAIIILLFRESPVKHYGFAIGNWREGLAWTFGLAGPFVALIWIGMIIDPDIKLMYRVIYYRDAGNIIDAGDHMYMFYAVTVQLFAWEYILRGFLLFGSARFIGPGGAILLQMIPFALLHLNKSEIEAFSTIFTGILFGIIAWRTKTFLYIFLIHVIILVTTNLLSVA